MVNEMGKRVTRDEQLQNLLENHAIIFTGIFEEAFSTIVDEMTEVKSPAGGAVMATGEGDKGRGVSARGPSSDRLAATAEGEQVLGRITPEILAHIRYVISEIREEITSQWPENSSIFRRYISSPDFDRGIEIVEKYDFGRPKLTEELTDEMLASYIFLVQSGNKKVEKMFKELSEWQSSLPTPPWN